MPVLKYLRVLEVVLERAADALGAVELKQVLALRAGRRFAKQEQHEGFFRQFNTFDAFVAVNGDKAQGGSIESDGPVLAGGHLLVNSGYQFGSRMAGNALLVFAPTSASMRATAVEELVGE